MKKYTDKIELIINDAEEGKIFIIADFKMITNSTNIRQCLHRLVKKGKLKRIMNGIFEKPKYNTVINDYVAPNPNEIAKAIARNYHWCIYPAGNTALNILGLSTQVSNNWEYISDGRYVSYKFPSLTIRFKHRTNKEVTNLSSITAIFIEALKTLGKNNVNDNIINKLKQQLSVNDKKTLLKEGKEATDWIYDIIKKIQTENI